MDTSIRHPRRGRGVYCFTSVRPSFRPSKIFFVAFFSVTVDGRNLIFGHKLHIGTPYRGKCFWTHQIPTSCLPTLLIFIHIEHTLGIWPFLVAFFSAGVNISSQFILFRPYSSLCFSIDCLIVELVRIINICH